MQTNRESKNETREKKNRELTSLTAELKKIGPQSVLVWA